MFRILVPWFINQKFISTIVSKTLNDLPLEMGTVLTLSCFKSRLKRLIVSEVFLFDYQTRTFSLISYVLNPLVWRFSTWIPDAELEIWM